MKTIERYSLGTGDRFGRQGAAQIAAFRKAKEKGVDVADSGGDGLPMTREIYHAAYGRFDEIVDIDRKKLPSPDEVDRWEGPALVTALRHVQSDKRFNPGMRQLVHVAFRVAVAMGGRYFEALERHEVAVSRNVTVNLSERHLVPLFIG